MSSVTTERLYKPLFYKFFCKNLSQVVLRWFYTERFLRNTICVILICLISSFNTNLKRQNPSDLLKNCIIHISMPKITTISQFTRSD